MESRRRRYRMRSRADSVAETGRRILQAMQDAFAEQRYEDVTVAEVAERARVTVQTVLRRFGSKDGLLVAAAQDARAQVLAERGAAAAGDLPAAVRNLFDHYERWGAVALRLLEQEERLPRIAAITRDARRLHAEWVSRVFGRELARLGGRPRARRLAQLIALTDVYVWKLLRRDLGVGRPDAEAIVLDTIDAVCTRGGG